MKSLIDLLNENARIDRIYSFVIARNIIKLMIVDAMTHDDAKGKNEMSRNTTNAKRNTKTRAFPIVLKTIIDDAMRDKTIVDDNAKKIRAKLRVAFRDTHAKNTSWVANNQRDYDAIRCAFDARYNERMIASRKRNAKKRDTTSNDATNDANATNDA